MTTRELAHPDYSLPPTVSCYKETPEWTCDTMPAGLKRAHSTMAGVWVQLTVLEGSMTFVYEKPELTKRTLGKGEQAVAPPQVLHHVEPGGEGLLFKLRFFREPTTVEGLEGQEQEGMMMMMMKTGVGAIDKEHTGAKKG